MSSADAIRAARAAINDAIARRDAEAIGTYLLPDYHVVTARSVQRSGKDESVKSWAAMFELDPHATFVRTPDEIHVNEEWGMAHEHGRWEGVDLGGIYSAKWHRTADGWRLQAEIFTAVGRRMAHVPKEVRDPLDVGLGDKITWEVKRGRGCELDKEN